MRRRSEIAIIVAVAIIVVGGLIALVSAYSANNSTSALAHFVALDAASVQASNGKSAALKAGQASDIHVGDTIQGSGTLTFTGAAVDLAPKAQVTLTHYTGAFSTQIEMTLQAGQILQQVGTDTQDNIAYTISTGAGSLATHGGKFLAFIDKRGATEFGAVYGSASVNAAGTSVVVTTGQGTTVSTGVAPAQPSLWSPVRVTTYQPDGSSQPLPLTLTDNVGNDPLYFTSGQPLIVPPGTYDLKVMAVIAYQAHSLKFDTQAPNEYSVTMAQAVFTTVDGDGTPVPFRGLLLDGDEQAHVAPEQPILISPGSSILKVANDIKPDAEQPVPMNLLPGQKAIIPIRTDLFGGARVKLNVSAPEGVTVAPMTVTVFPAANENGTPIDTFSSDTSSALLPPGDYVVIMPADIAGRYPVTIANSQDVAIDAGLGTLSINYQDASGQASNPFMYVAVADAMERLNLPIDQMQQTKFGRYLRSSVKLLVPAGKYNIRVDDPKKDVDVSGVEVQPRSNVVLPISASGSN